MLAGAGLGDDARLAHALCEKRLTERVVDLVGAGVGEVLALQPDRRAARVLREPRGRRQLRRTADELAQEPVELEQERRIGARGAVGVVEFLERVQERLWHIAAAEHAEAAALVGNARVLGGRRIGWCGRHGGTQLRRPAAPASRRKIDITGPESA